MLREPWKKLIKTFDQKKKSISESLLILAGTITATVPARVEKRLIWE